MAWGTWMLSTVMISRLEPEALVCSLCHDGIIFDITYVILYLSQFNFMMPWLYPSPFWCYQVSQPWLYKCGVTWISWYPISVAHVLLFKPSLSCATLKNQWHLYHYLLIDDHDQRENRFQHLESCTRLITLLVRVYARYIQSTWWIEVRDIPVKSFDLSSKLGLWLNMV